MPFTLKVVVSGVGKTVTGVVLLITSASVFQPTFQLVVNNNNQLVLLVLMMVPVLRVHALKLLQVGLQVMMPSYQVTFLPRVNTLLMKRAVRLF